MFMKADLLKDFHHLYLKKGVALYLNKFEYPIFKDTLYKDRLNFVQWFLERKILNILLRFALSPIRKRIPRQLNKNLKP